MFKRLTKFNTQKQKNVARGIDVSQDAPPEVLMDEESGSDSDSDSDGDEEEGSSDGDDDDEDQQATATTSRGKKRKSIDDEDEDGSDSDSDSDSDSASSSSSSTEPYDDSVPPISLSQSLESPLYISPLSPLKAGEPWTTCLVCPLAQLKSSTAVEVHQGSKAHKRRYERYVKYVETRLTETERVNDFEAGGADPRGIVKEIEGELERRQGKGEGKKKKGKQPPSQKEKKSKETSEDQQKAKVGTSPSAQSEKARARSERKKAHKKAWKEAKEERKKQKKLEAQEEGPATASGEGHSEEDLNKSEASRDKATPRKVARGKKQASKQQT